MESGRHDVFRQNYLVYGLPDDKIDELIELASFETKLANEDICRRGEKGCDLFVVLDGTVTITSLNGEKLAEIGPGSVIGEVALVDDQPRSANAVCKSAVHYARLPARELRNYMVTHKDVGFHMLANLSRVLSARLRQTDAVVDELAGKQRDPWDFAS
ncbi:MAG: cyclic nucleotide-binding domain-containing protein [Fimbriimonadaceae bacterium]|nr:cyclic nucleotide-binding domain-containing protein [Fimbriimonadaceae bacterium]QYK54986.1 MAG: cyclic nucleotide-binding domain-containing protein [Fimbriimonadaceae bacterium]